MSQEPSEALGTNDEIPGFEQKPEHDARDAIKNSDLSWQAELITRCLTGDEHAFAHIIDQYGSLLLRTAYLIVRDEEAAKDIVQDTFILAWKNLGKLREPAFLRAWLLKIVVNQSMSLKRQWARKAALLREQMAQSYIDTTIQAADLQRGRIEERLDVELAIEQLPMNQRIVLVLFYYHRMTMPEIAVMLGVAENTLRKRLQAALNKIRRVLGVELERTQHSSSEGIEARFSIHKGGA